MESQEDGTKADQSENGGGFVLRDGAPPSKRKRAKRIDPAAVRERVLETLRSEQVGKASPSESAAAITADAAPLPGTEPAIPVPRSFQDAGALRSSEAIHSESTTQPSVIALPAASKPEDPIPARMLNEFVYCQRLFYYEYVEGVFVESADTLRGQAIHKKVDAGNGALPAAKRKSAPVSGAVSGVPPETSSAAKTETEGETRGGAESETIHSRSVQMGSDRLGVVAKMDLVEVKTGKDDLLEAIEVCPVDYKAGAPKEGADANELWDTDKMQLGLQALILRDNGYACSEGIIYYRATRQRIRLPITPELESWIVRQIAEARRISVGPIPPPLTDSPKCVRCSLAPICLPDETRMLSHKVADEVTRLTSPSTALLNPEILSPSPDNNASTPTNQSAEPSAEPVDPAGPEKTARTSSSGTSQAPRRLIASRDDTRPLYLNTPGLRVGCNGEVLQVRERDAVVQEVRLRDLSHVALFGNIQISTQAIQNCCEQEIPVTYFSMGGWFYGITRGHGLKNIFLRIEQFRSARDEEVCLGLAKTFVQGKIRNHRTLLMRNHLEPPEPAILRLKRAAEDALGARSLEELLGIEGAAASQYFKEFNGMIKVADDLAALNEENAEEKPRDEKGQLAFNFNFAQRNRRPPPDPVNAMLSLAYSLLTKDCTLAALAVGFDPWLGFCHQPRFGRPALALDLMEEFRPLIAESTVLTCINNRVITEDDFVRAGQAVNLSPAGRKRFFQTYEQRMNSLITHPLFDYKVSYRRALELQARLLSKVLTGEIPEYIPLTTR
jgi:CRISPR-associated protein Cas1